MEKFAAIIEAAEFDHYGVRAHRSSAVIGKTLGNSKVWVDGEATDEELNGISTIKVKSTADLDKAIGTLQAMYCWDNETIVLVGGFTGSWGEDAGEFVIEDNICLAVL